MLAMQEKRPPCIDDFAQTFPKRKHREEEASLGKVAEDEEEGEGKNILAM